jgi:hypothetical protein
MGQGGRRHLALEILAQVTKIIPLSGHLASDGYFLTVQGMMIL